MTISLKQLNDINASMAFDHFYQCLSVKRWAQDMVDGRPYRSIDSIIKTAKQQWATATEAEHLEAFAGHPTIGDINSLAEKYRNTESLASNEQSAVNQASDATLKALSQLNASYLNKFGFIFIVFATNKSADEMLTLLKTRIDNERDQEIHTAGSEQLKITELRLRKLLL